MRAVEPSNQPVAKARVARRLPANRGRLDTDPLAVCVQLGNDLMMFAHGLDCANRHSRRQVPNDTLPQSTSVALSCAMGYDFRRAFVWHLEKHETKLADLVRETGVSRDVLNKLKAREDSSTSVENALLIAAYYGKSIADFVAMRDATESSASKALFDLLTPEEQRLVEAQMRGLVLRNAAKQA